MAVLEAAKWFPLCSSSFQGLRRLSEECPIKRRALWHFWGKSILGRGIAAAKTLMLKRAWYSQEIVVGEKVREEMRSQIVWGLASPYQGFGFYTL